MQIPLDIEELFRKAEDYHRRGDIYNAIKLCKRIIRQVPEWHSPHAMLGNIYKYQQDWKATLHYNKKAAAIDASDQTAWWNIGIAATALKKPRLAKSVWSKFGFEDEKWKQKSVRCARITLGKQFDIVWVNPLDPARGVIQSIPLPATGRRFRDIVLLDGEVSGYNIAKEKKYPVYEELGVYKRSNYHTFSCQIQTQHINDFRYLEKLCRKANLGFENWSNVARVFANRPENKLPEYYGTEMMHSSVPMQEMHVAIAAPALAEVEEVLHSWQVISLGHFRNLTFHL